jgi:hypothetical protein
MQSMLPAMIRAAAGTLFLIMLYVNLYCDIVASGETPEGSTPTAGHRVILSRD